MNNNMLRNLIELNDRPGGFTTQDFHANFPEDEETWIHLGELANAGLVTPVFANDMLENVGITQEGRDYLANP